MPRGGKKAGSKARALAGRDVSVYDFAHASIQVHGQRLKKSAVNSFTREAKECSFKDSNNLLWFEKEIESFTLEDIEDVSNTIQEDALKTRRPKKNRFKEQAEEDDKGLIYPLDMWFILGDYIKPEDVSTFSMICKGSLYVTNSARFWYRLYKRYYTSDVSLPTRLQPDCMERPRNLRACVVRSLFHFYPPFVDRLKGSISAQEAEESTLKLIRSLCVLNWYQKQESGTWDFFFKFQGDVIMASDTWGSLQQRRPDLLSMLENVNANQEAGCKVLKVSCKSFVSIPAVLGMKLVHIQISVGNRLRMTLSTTGYLSNQSVQPVNSVVFVMESVVGLSVMNWWHPQYPCAGNF